MSKFLLVGLGNIGPEYAGTRHNIGFDVLHTFVLKHKGAFEPERLAYVAEVKFKGKTIVCICPTTYMNLSGRAVNYWMQKEGIPLENVMVLVDDLALPVGKIRIRSKGSDAGHNGLKSIQQILGRSDYARLRFGIGNDFPKGFQVDHVLGRWDDEEYQTVNAKMESCAEIIKSFVTIGIERTMNLYNNK